MKISVITPSFNQAQFLPANLESVRTQRGVTVEHIVVDPGSKDGSLEIARRATDITLIAEPDRGQSDGICKGFSRSTGDILVWLNSDDFYPSNDVLASVLQCFEDNPDIDIVYGDVNFVGESGEFLRKGFVNTHSDQLLASFQFQVGIVQPGVFWRRSVFEQLGGPSEEFEYCMDYELWVRMASKGYRWKYIPKVLAHHRWWAGMKTSSRRDLSLREHFKVCARYFGYVHWKWLDRYAEFLCSNQDGVVNHAHDTDETEKASKVRQTIDELITGEMLCKLALATDDQQIETRQYMERFYPEKRRIYFDPKELVIESETSADPLALQRVAWNVFDVKTTGGGRFSAYHVPDNFDRYFDHGWHAKQLQRATVQLAKLGRERRGNTCVIVGNGPSLGKSDLSLLADFDTIMSNFAVMSPELSRYSKILTVVNDLVAKQGAVDFNSCPLVKFVPFWLASSFNDSDSTFFVNATVRPEFSKNFVESASWRSTVSFFNMQLAYAIGYRKVILIGFDHSYVQPKGVSEGVVISQVEDDENHFDPRYFKGKDWQAADTDNMEKMYVVAKAAYESDGREIVNCTVGGKLEVFRRGDLATELSEKTRSDEKGMPVREERSLPRLLMIDSTPIGHGSATGQLKQTFLEGWPSESFLQVWEKGGQKPTLHTIRIGQSIEDSKNRCLSHDGLIEECRSFSPDVIYVRPVDSRGLLEIAEHIVAAIHVPLVIHMMDDWPERLRLTNLANYSTLDASLRRLLTRASLHLSICDAMSAAYAARYGFKWKALANGVDAGDFPAKDWRQRSAVSPADPFVIRYMGGLADDMTFNSVMEIAHAVGSLRNEHPIRFEIHTMDWYREKAEKVLGGLPGVSVGGLVDAAVYQRFLCEADALVIAYNFDPRSISYIGLSLANKMPECLASGVPLLAYGPEQVATIAYLKEAECAHVVDRRDAQALRSAIEALVADLGHCRELGEAARTYATKHLAKQSVQERFRDFMMMVASSVLSRATGREDTAVGSGRGPAEPKQSAERTYMTEPSSHFSEIAENTWRYTHSGAKQKLWLATFGIDGSTTQREFVAHVRLTSTRAMVAIVSLGRSGTAEYEGTGTRISMTPGVAQSVLVRHKFSKHHATLKVQIEVLELEKADTANLKIESLWIAESLTSIRLRVQEEDQTLRFANRSFRDGDHLTAMGLYLVLCEHRPLRVYPDNALMAARKLGIDSVDSADELSAMLGQL